MQLLCIVTVLACALLESVVGLDWQNEVNVSICNWAQFRANVIRDTIYLDGGALWWQMGLSDGSNGVPQNDGNTEGVMYALNLGQPFNKTTNLTGLFQTMSETGGLATNNIAPNYIDGEMFANDGELITYGGMVSDTNSSSPPAADAILGYEAYEYGPARQSWSAGFINKELSTNITRYITNGAGVSAPSENMGYYFSGMRAADWGPIYQYDGSANTLADTLISVNMTVMREETWSNSTLPPAIPPRANAELAWIPAGDNGVLVALGGVIDPESLTVIQALNDSQANASATVSPTFMETVSLYDIANDQWYQANTTGDIPPQLTLFCSVVAPAADKSSFNIYIYGGYDGVNHTSIPSDDVYILSVPQMVWTHAYTGQSNHGRSGHKCFRVYPDQMMILGGVYAGNPLICLDGITTVFNLNNLKFQDSYDPRVWTEYSVPGAITAKIGGNGNGSATVQAPTALNSVFAMVYTKTVPSYYPYELQTPNTTSTSTSTPVPTTVTVKGGGGLPTWVGPVLGVVLGLIVIAAAVILFLLWRRRRPGRSAVASETQGSVSGIRGIVLRWLHGTGAQDEKGPVVLGADDMDGVTVVSKTHERHVSEADSVGVQEMESLNTPVFEMGNDHAPPWSELHWSQPERSPPLVSPNIDGLIYNNHYEGGLPSPGPSVESGLARPTQQNIRHTSNYSSGHRSDEFNISEIGSSDLGRPAHLRQTSDNSVSDANSIPASQEGSATELSTREQTTTATGVTTRRDRFSTVDEIDETDPPERITAPLREYYGNPHAQNNSTELE